MYTLQEEPIDLSGAFAGTGPESGATLVFAGTVRDDGMDLLDLETDPDEAERELGRIVGEAEERWDLTGIRIVHRFGPMKVGEVIVLIIVSAAHRENAYEASRFLIDEIKHRVPIWKKEISGERTSWVPGAWE